MDPETRAYLDEIRQDIRTLGNTLHGEMATLGDALRGEMATLATTLRVEIRRGDAATCSQLGAMIEGQRHDLAAVAEGVAANTMAIDRLRRDMDARFETVRNTLVVVRRDIEELRARP